MKFHFLLVGLFACSLALFSACEDGGGNNSPTTENVAATDASTTKNQAAEEKPSKSSVVVSKRGSTSEFGENDPNLVVCIGDSITRGYACDGPPYPSCLAALTGKNVRNGGVNGALSSAGTSAANAAVGTKPGFMCILYGANDAIHSLDPSSTAANIRSIIAICKANNVIPIVATPPPQIGEHKQFTSNSLRIGSSIKAVCASEGVSCVDLYASFGANCTPLMTSDGLHPNASGAQLIASCFARCMK